jgi:ribosomal protein S18 acetylase RimI-like enzyme
MLKIRPFIEGKDEPAYIDIINRALKELPDFTPITISDALFGSKSPNFNQQGRFIAEWNNQPAGYIYACLNTKREDKHGYFDGPYIVPEFRRKHIGAALAETAIQNFKTRGIKIIEREIRSTNIPAQKFLEKFSFRIHHISSRMKRTLSELPGLVGENNDIKIIDIGTDNQALKLENYLMNEIMKDHFNFRPMTLEETQYCAREQEKLGVKYNNFVAYVNNVPVGFTIVIIDPREIQHQKKNLGWLSMLGVLKTYRSKGIGKALMIHVLKFLKTEGIEEVLLEVDDTNITKAIMIYEGLGFKVTLKICRYMKELS